jgi:hypothetical protein
MPPRLPAIIAISTDTAYRQGGMPHLRVGAQDICQSIALKLFWGWVEDLEFGRQRTVPFFRSAAFLLRAFAAALDALIALSLRCLAVNFFARAWPPRRPISAKNFETGESSSGIW